MMRKIFLMLAVFAVGLAGGFAGYAATFNQQAAIKKISAAAAALKTMQCDFVQTKHLKMLGDEMVSKGKMYCSQPDKLRWQYTTPYQYTFVLNANKVSITKGKRNDVIDVQKNKMFKEIARIMMNTVLGKCFTGKDFKTSVAEKDGTYIATLTPLKKEMRQMFSKIVLHYNKQASTITTVELHEKNGDRTYIEMKNIRKNQPVNASLFKIG